MVLWEPGNTGGSFFRKTVLSIDQWSSNLKDIKRRFENFIHEGPVLEPFRVWKGDSKILEWNMVDSGFPIDKTSQMALHWNHKELMLRERNCIPDWDYIMEWCAVGKGQGYGILATHLSKILTWACSTLLRMSNGDLVLFQNAPQPRTRARSLPVPSGVTASWHCKKKRRHPFHSGLLPCFTHEKAQKVLFGKD